MFTCLRVKVYNGLVPEACSRVVQRGNFEPSVLCHKVVADHVKQAWESLYVSLSRYSAMPLLYFAAGPSSVAKHTHFSLGTVKESIHCPVDILIANLHKAVVYFECFLLLL